MSGDQASRTGGGRLDRAVFDDLHRIHDDPWSFESSPYEARKRAITIASLTRDRYARGFEPGCSIGVLAEQLAPRCETLLAADVSERAVARARRRLGAVPGVEVARLEVPWQWPSGRFDLIVLSELGYFLDAGELGVLIDLAAGALTAGGDLVAVHWLGPIDGYPLDGRAVHAQIDAHPALERIVRHEEEAFVLEVFRR